MLLNWRTNINTDNDKLICDRQYETVHWYSRENETVIKQEENSEKDKAGEAA